MYSPTRLIRKYLLPMISLFLLLAVSAPLPAAEAEFKSISSERLKDMVDENKAFILIDARTKAEYQEAHIGKAINIPDKEFDGLVSLLPVDKHSLMIIYCNGIKCGKSKKVAHKLRDTTTFSSTAKDFLSGKRRGCRLLPGPIMRKKSRRRNCPQPILKSS